MSNEEKTRALGMNFGTASSRLRKLILFDFMQRLDLDECFQCGKQIEDVDDLSIEHKRPWQPTNDPKDTFFDLDNIAFSHLSCNSGAANGGPKRKEQCEQGHPMVVDNIYQHPNGSRICKVCRRRRQERYRNTNRLLLAQKTRERYRNLGRVV